ncbi:MAG TPA: class I SAM-dependent methyltransferase, partial [Gemmataceae bacterium]|nr:class I SAM-dependent methyltransferase [Gemmataceae bacterium]
MALSTEAEIEASYRDGAAQYVADRFRAGLHRLLHERRVAAVQRVIDQIFDLVYTFRFVRHFRRSDRERLYVQVRRVLKPGGYFVLDAVNER